MRNSLWYKRIPTLLGLILLVGGMVTVNWAINHNVFFITKASPTYTPEEIRITNLTDTSFSVSYITQTAVLGSLTYGTTPQEGKVALDDRDQAAGNPQAYSIHHITLNNLQPKQIYYFSIISANKTFLNNSVPFTVTTLPPLDQSPTQQQPIIGNVAYPNGNKDGNIVVYLVSDNAQTLSVLTKSDGTFVMPLNALRTKDFSSYVSLTPQSIIKLLAESATNKATISVLASQISPVPPIILGNAYDFTAPISPIPVASTSADTSSFPSFSATEASPHPDIITPNKDELFKDQQPEFQGTAVPGSSVEIEIHSDAPISSTVTANTNGSWSYRPTTKLAPGQHTITIKTKDSKGVLQTITQSFTVYAAGSQFVEPSVSPTNSPTPTLSPTPTVTPLPSPTETLSPTLTPSTTATPTPTLEPTATPTQFPPTGILTQSLAPLEESPGSSVELLSGIIAFIMIGAGATLLFLSRNNSL
ncbi:MAG TPA: Ig-like domain-containing protein [Patescibacteria group bacterium]|nr:Ig-like domain-containing protein [Patescibacteria group bacterium]